MGLGKTLSSIAVIAGHPSEDRKVRTTLVVAPLALLEQYVCLPCCSILTIRWKAEIESKTTSGRKVLIHWGGKRTDSAIQLKQYDVVLTTYGILTAEHGKQVSFFRSKDGLDADQAETETETKAQSEEKERFG
jgi:SNF2 family DNA or RNA helicase